MACYMDLRNHWHLSQVSLDLAPRLRWVAFLAIAGQQLYVIHSYWLCQRYSEVVFMNLKEQSNKAARARYAEEFIPFAKRLSKAAEAIVTHDFVLDSVCRREVMDLGDRSIEALESA